MLLRHFHVGFLAKTQLSMAHNAFESGQIPPRQSISTAIALSDAAGNRALQRL